MFSGSAIQQYLQALPALDAIARRAVQLRQVEEILGRLALLVGRVERHGRARENRNAVGPFKVARECGEYAGGCP